MEPGTKLPPANGSGTQCDMISVPPSSPAGNCIRCSVPLSSGTDDGMCTRCLLQGALESLSDYDEADDERSSFATLLRDRQIGGYHLLGGIRPGGGGLVFKERQPYPARLVAVKGIAARQTAPPGARQGLPHAATTPARQAPPDHPPHATVGAARPATRGGARAEPACDGRRGASPCGGGTGSCAVMPTRTPTGNPGAGVCVSCSRCSSSATLTSLRVSRPGCAS